MYQALYRKYRPQVFEDVVGQRSVTETLKNQVVTGHLSHAYLFTGTRGTGKTSCAKILSKAVNCLDPHDGSPCNQCANCRSIDSGSCMDVLEIDAASNNGVDNVRTLRDESIYTPSEVKRRVYIIDEVHMLSMQAFNALLKIIEEPPEHLIFILATTELQKVPATILSRCQRFSFRRLLPEDIAQRLNYVAYQEGIAVEQDALELLARLADGALRDGLSLLDQCASANTGILDAESVYRCLGLAGDRKTAALFESIARQDAAAALELFSELYAGGKDVSAMVGEMTSLARDLLLLKTAPKSGASMLSGVCTGQELQSLLGQFSSAQLLRITALLQRTASGFSQSADRRLDTELCLVELCAPELQTDLQSLNARLGRLEQAAASGQLVAASAPEQPLIPPEPAAPIEVPDPVPVPQEAKKAPAAAVEQLPVGFWTDLLASVSGSLQPGERSVLKSQVKPRLQDGVLLLTAQNPWVKGLLDRPENLGPIQKMADQLLGRPVPVKLALEGAVPDGGEDGFAALLNFGAQHGDLIDIK